MRFIFSRAEVLYGTPYPSPFGNFGKDYFDVTNEGFLECDGVKGLIEKLRHLLQEKE